MDYASFNDLGQTLNITEALMGNGPIGNENNVLGSLWLTNRFGGASNNITIPTMGIINQMRVCAWQPCCPFIWYNDHYRAPPSPL